MFSIVIPLYNKELSIIDTIQSVLNQDFKEFEIVVVNDGSTDSSALKVESTFGKDSRIRLIHQVNQGVSVARNRGIKEADREWIVFLDADDLWKPNHLLTFANMINEFPEDKVFCTSHTKSKIHAEEGENSRYQVIDDYFEEVMRDVDFFWTSACCIHRSVFHNVGGFVTKLSRGEDLDVWARIGRRYRIVRSFKRTAVYRTDSENKLTASRSIYEKSIVSLIDLKGLKGNERSYFKKMILRRVKKDFRFLDLVTVLKILKRHNVELFK